MKTWLWTKILFFILLSGVFVLVALPENIKSTLPGFIQDRIVGKDLKLGIDLRGGTQIEYAIDFTAAEQQVALTKSDNDPKNDLDAVNRNEIANGVKETLQRRIDPDGTKEVNISVVDINGEKHITVALTADIDTPEMRSKLEKSIDLQFKEPMTGDDRKAIATSLLAKISKGESSFESAGKELGITVDPQELSYDQIKNSFQANGEKLWNAEFGKVFPEPLTTVQYAVSGGQLVSQDVALVAVPKEKKMKDKTVQQAEKKFLEAKVDFKNSGVPKAISEIDQAFVEPVAKLEQGGISDVLENANGYFLYTRLPVVKGEVASKYDEIFIGKTEEKAKEKIDAAKKSVTPQEKTIKEEVLVLQTLAISDQWKDTPLGGAQFKNAKPSSDQNGIPVTAITFNAQGAQLFEEFTGRLSVRNNPICSDSKGGTGGDQFAIFVGGELISAPCVHEKISGGSAIITSGAQSYKSALDYATKLSNDLNAGATPAPIHVISERKISAALGDDAMEKSIISAGLGFLAVAIWMLVFYRFLGFIAIIALSFYALAIIFILKYFGFIVLTLAGVAGIILSVGMAVDANILIFERIKEELKDGKNFASAVALGFERAWTSIRDSNISSLITCLILFAFGTSIIKGFSVALALGILLSMFTAITLTRMLILALTPKIILEKKFLLGA